MAVMFWAHPRRVRYAFVIEKKELRYGTQRGRAFRCNLFCFLRLRLPKGKKGFTLQSLARFASYYYLWKGRMREFRNAERFFG